MGRQVRSNAVDVLVVYAETAGERGHAGRIFSASEKRSITAADSVPDRGGGCLESNSAMQATAVEKEKGEPDVAYFSRSSSASLRSDSAIFQLNALSSGSSAQRRSSRSNKR